MHRHVGQAMLILNNPDLVRTKQHATEVVGPEEAAVIMREAEVEVEVIAEVEVEVLAEVREEAEAAEEDDSDYFL